MYKIFIYKNNRKPILHNEHFDKEHTEELLRHLTDELMKLIGGLVGKEYKHHYALSSGDSKEVIEGEVVEK